MGPMCMRGYDGEIDQPERSGKLSTFVFSGTSVGRATAPHRRSRRNPNQSGEGGNPSLTPFCNLHVGNHYVSRMIFGSIQYYSRSILSTEPL